MTDANKIEQPINSDGGIAFTGQANAGRHAAKCRTTSEAVGKPATW